MISNLASQLSNTFIAPISNRLLREFEKLSEVFISQLRYSDKRVVGPRLRVVLDPGRTSPESNLNEQQTQQKIGVQLTSGGEAQNKRDPYGKGCAS